MTTLEIVRLGMWGAIALLLLVVIWTAWSDHKRRNSIPVQVRATVIGHRKIRHDETNFVDYQARLTFKDEGTEYEVLDQVASRQPHPPVGTGVDLEYPDGSPRLARRPGVKTSLMFYVMPLIMVAVLLYFVLDM